MKFIWNEYDLKYPGEDYPISQEIRKIRKKIERAVVYTHLDMIDRVSKRGLGKPATSISTVNFTIGKGVTYNNDDTMKIGLVRHGGRATLGQLIREIEFDTAHETGHHLHVNANPVLAAEEEWTPDHKNGIWMPTRNHFARELVAEFAALSYFKQRDRLSQYTTYSTQLNRMYVPALQLFRRNETLLPKLARMETDTMWEKHPSTLGFMQAGYERFIANLLERRSQPPPLLQPIEPQADDEYFILDLEPKDNYLVKLVA